MHKLLDHDEALKRVYKLLEDRYVSIGIIRDAGYARLGVRQVAPKVPDILKKQGVLVSDLRDKARTERSQLYNPKKALSKYL